MFATVARRRRHDRAHHPQVDEVMDISDRISVMRHGGDGGTFGDWQRDAGEYRASHVGQTSD